MDFIAVGVFPPPNTGQSVAFKNFCDNFLPDSRRINVSGGQRFYKLSKFFQYVLAVFQCIFCKEKYIYYSLNSGFGLYLDVFFIFTMRFFNKRFVIHHHSYGYINSFSKRVSYIVSVLSSEDTMIFLSPKMRSDFQRLYRADVETYCLNNIFQYESSDLLNEIEPDESHGEVVVGYLSNVTIDKGFSIFCDLIEALADIDCNMVRFVVAGPFADDSAQDRYDNLSSKAKSLVEYVGPVYGDQKASFFSSLDLFAFPTIYKNEAQPMVLVEALQHGIPVLATGRGSISDLLGDDFPTVSPAEFVAVALNLINSLSSSRSLRFEMRKMASSRFTALKDLSKNEVKVIREVISESQSAVS